MNEYRYEIERLMRDLNDMKRKYFETKRREQIEKERGGLGASGGAKALSGLLPLNPNQPRFTGGGFSLNTQP